MDVARRLPREPASVAKARRAIEELNAGLDPETMATLRLLVSELVTNSVQHGGSGGPGEIELSVSASARTVRVEVSDRGPGFAPRPRLDEHDEGSGWGLHLVDALSHRWGTERGPRMHIWFEIDHSEPAAA